ncbi:MAG: hypothetical protein Q9216_005744 [Gyalolechia sp. 2 TL-2023]
MEVGRWPEDGEEQQQRHSAPPPLHPARDEDGCRPGDSVVSSGREEGADEFEANEHVDDDAQVDERDMVELDGGSRELQQQEALLSSGREEGMAVEEEEEEEGGIYDVVDPKEALEPFAWDDLEGRFLRGMEECGRREEEILREFGGWCSAVKPFFSLQRYDIGKADFLSRLIIGLQGVGIYGPGA